MSYLWLLIPDNFRIFSGACDISVFKKSWKRKRRRSLFLQWLSGMSSLVWALWHSKCVAQDRYNGMVAEAKLLYDRSIVVAAVRRAGTFKFSDSSFGHVWSKGSFFQKKKKRKNKKVWYFVKCGELFIELQYRQEKEKTWEKKLEKKTSYRMLQVIFGNSQSMTEKGTGLAI